MSSARISLIFVAFASQSIEIHETSDVKDRLYSQRVCQVESVVGQEEPPLLAAVT
jgi:hypothetical protein